MLIVSHNPPTINDVTNAQQLINAIKSSVANENSGGPGGPATPPDVTAVIRQLENINSIQMLFKVYLILKLNSNQGNYTIQEQLLMLDQ